MKGKCLCGQIEFEFDAGDDVAMNCYCSICRRSHGAAYATQLLSKKSSLKCISGEDKLKEYASSEFGIRAFCENCGSRLMNYAKADSDYMSVSIACVSDEHNIKPIANVQMASKTAWAVVDENVESFDVFPDDIAKYMQLTLFDALL